jgi:hypothetical protein
MPKLSILTTAEAKTFLTKVDLEKLTKLLTEGKLSTLLVPNEEPVIEVRGSLVKYFDVISLLGTV